MTLPNDSEADMNSPEALALKIAQILDDKKALDITILKVDHMTTVADYMVIASGRSVSNVHALYEDVTDKLAEEDILWRRTTACASPAGSYWITAA